MTARRYTRLHSFSQNAAKVCRRDIPECERKLTKYCWFFIKSSTKIHMEIDMLAKLLKDESGATAIEYSLIAALVAVSAIGGMRLLGTSLNSMFSTVGTTLQSAA
jgi:pilus assembly protein Flp/PilA